jgi:hypothetical protein
MLEIVTRVERLVAIEGASAAVRAADGWIDDVNFFSNILVVIQFSLPSSKCNVFLQAIAAAGLHIEEAAASALVQAEASIEDNSVSGALRITFVNDEPDIRRTVPMVPG